MCWVIICPVCEKRLLLTDSEDRDPEEFGLVIDDFTCGNCGVDMHAALKQYADEYRKTLAKTKQNKNPPPILK